ncbi:Kelch repeat-containing protein [Virgisporangium aurantiacum]|uniref:Kelch repeat-containing protein n=1 Tax=Virgisporangium aurantiacum TaxID=175570 RepID=UPI0019516EF9|nr:kelch repeat-containing protein [Virgisporangium aurantiacum]
MSEAAEPWRLGAEYAPPPEVTLELFAAWRAARRGSRNPERMTNPVWVWLARQPEVNAYQASRHFGQLPESWSGWSPGWCNDRYGQCVITLPDGRVLSIAGEHEDFYDPDFFIYNDVIVTAPDGTVDIFGYPPDVFPPTDFHSATLAGDHVYVLGNVGYADARGAHAQLLRFDVRTLSFAALEAGGEDPGWLSHHTAVLGADGRTLRVTGGQVEVTVAGQGQFRDNVDDYELDLDRLLWTRTTDRRWRQYRVAREVGRSKLWELSQLAYHSTRDSTRSRAEAAEYRAKLGLDADLAAWNARYRPPVPHETIPDVDEEWSVHRIRVDGVIVRYVERHSDIHVVVEGPLQAGTEAALVEDLRVKLARAEAAPYTSTSLEPVA